MSFFTGLIAGMLIIQIFFHRFRVPLPAEKSPETPIEPRKLMSYAIHANPALGWRRSHSWRSSLSGRYTRWCDNSSVRLPSAQANSAGVSRSEVSVMLWLNAILCVGRLTRP